ncbi:MAG: hypothetical protein ABIS68_11455 [Casimicrobiaceae bacterium]
MQTIADPRVFPRDIRNVPDIEFRWHEWAEQSLTAATGDRIDASDAQLQRAMVSALVARDVGRIKSTLDSAPSAVVYRHLFRALVAAWGDPALDGDAQLVAHGFAIPIVLVAVADTAVELPMTLGDSQAISDVLTEHDCLAGNKTFVVANVLAASSLVEIDSLPRWLAWRAADDAMNETRDIAPAPLRVVAGQEGAHLRYLAGSALAARNAPLFGQVDAGRWGLPLAKVLSNALAANAVQLLALPRAPAPPVIALQQGELAQREIAMQLFATNAIRNLRANFGEPSAVISSHRTDGGGELRLSLSSVFGERDAEGFRCPLFPYDRVEDVLAQMIGLLRSCRIPDIRVLEGIHGDREPGSGRPLFFRADAIGPGKAVPYH